MCSSSPQQFAKEISCRAMKRTANKCINKLMMDKKSSDVLLNALSSCHDHHSSLNSLKMSHKKDHLTILNPASVSGIDHLRVLPPPSARIQVHLRAIHSNTTILCQYPIIHVWIERGGFVQSLLSTKTMP